jgi:uncharacterized Zn-finger protein
VAGSNQPKPPYQEIIMAITTHQAETKTASPPPIIEVKPSDLPLSCPRPGEELWNMHPRVYLPIDESPDGEAICPYCGAHYRLIK